MSALNDILELVTVEPTFPGYAPTGQALPYVVGRHLYFGDPVRNLDGSGSGWDTQYSLYCVAASSEASGNLAIMVMQELDGKRVAGTTLSTSMGYVGAVVEGAYESQVTVQLNQGEL